MQVQDTTNPKPKMVYHGYGHTSEYRIWGLMISRCHRETDSSYKNYGGRGITVCDAWRESFLAFYRDMGPRPSKSHSIDRKDNSLGYCPENCHWATRVEQQRNTTRNHFLTHGGSTLTISAWSEKLGWPPYVIGLRLRRGWAVEKALTTPLMRQPRITTPPRG